MNNFKILRVFSLIACFAMLPIGQASAALITSIFEVEVASTQNDLGAFTVGDSYQFQFSYDNEKNIEIWRYHDGIDNIAHTADDGLDEIFIPENTLWDNTIWFDGVSDFKLIDNPFQILIDTWNTALVNNSATANDVFDQNTLYVTNSIKLNGSAAGFTADSIDIFLGTSDLIKKALWGWNEGFEGGSFSASYLDSQQQKLTANVNFKLTSFKTIPEPNSLILFIVAAISLTLRNIVKKQIK